MSGSLTAQTPVETILEKHPAAVEWLLRRGVVCLRCGEPFWGGLGELLTGRGFSAEETARIIAELNAHLAHLTE